MSNPIPPEPNPCGRPSPAQWIWAAMFFLSLGLAALTLGRQDLWPGVRYAVPIVCLGAGLGYIKTMLRDLRSQSDELQLRIYLESTAITSHGLFVAMLVYPAFEKAGLVGPLDYSMVLVLLVALGMGGYLMASRRYR
jgi:hypothetical protein